MSQTLIAILVLGVLLVIAALAFALRKAGFTVNTIKAKLPMVEVEARRENSLLDKEATSSNGSKIRQRAEEGGIIEESGITAPADSAAEIDQLAKGEKSKIDDSPIELT